MFPVYDAGADTSNPTAVEGDVIDTEPEATMRLPAVIVVPPAATKPAATPSPPAKLVSAPTRSKPPLAPAVT